MKAIPCKTFLVGEYAVLEGGEALGIATGPGFTLSSKKISYHPDSAVSLLLGTTDFYQVDSKAPGGFGKSTAEFIFAYLQKNKNSRLDAILNSYLGLFVIFGNGQVLDLAHLSVEYRFLGDTNPNDFQAQQLFDVDTFFQVRTAGGGTVDLAPQAFNGATFSAQADTYTITNFSFSASGGASFTATPVPEPGAWVMLLAGLAGLAGARGAGARRRSPA